jgi:hypothetical protein
MGNCRILSVRSLASVTLLRSGTAWMQKEPSLAKSDATASRAFGLVSLVETRIVTDTQPPGRRSSAQHSSCAGAAPALAANEI